MPVNKLIRRVPISEMDTVKERRKIVGNKMDADLLTKCEQLWMNMEEFREQRARALRFTYGDQWGDLITVNGKTMTQREYLQQTGNIILQTNQIKNKVDTIVGVLIKEKNEPVCNARDRDEQQYGEIMTTALQANCYKNKMESLYVKYMRDVCIGGFAINKESYDWKEGRLDSWSEYCDPNYIFFDSEMTDPRFWDIHLIGQFFDMTFEGIAAKFAKSEKDYARLKEIFLVESDVLRPVMTSSFEDKVDYGRLSFRYPEDRSKCRIFEVWQKETKARIRLHDTNEGTLEVIDADDAVSVREVNQENKRRKALARSQGFAEDEIPLIETEFFIDEYWYCRYLSPEGHVIWEGESPYADRMHPFSMIATPFVGGRIVGYMNDAIDHNIAMNRVIILQDWLARTQAKGVTVVPKKIVPDQDYDKFAKSWTSIDDMVFIDMKEGEEGLMPKVFYGTAQTYNASEMIRVYQGLMENSTAVSGALQGKTPYSGTSGAMYAQQTANSSTPIASLMSQFHSFLEELHTKKMKNIAKFYDLERLQKIAGNIDGLFDNANINLNEVGEIEYDLSIKESTETPVYRAIINDDAKEFLMNGLISFEEYLQIADVPYADKILQSRQARQAEQEAAMQGEVPQAAINEAQEKANTIV